MKPGNYEENYKSFVVSLPYVQSVVVFYHPTCIRTWTHVEPQAEQEFLVLLLLFFFLTKSAKIIILFVSANQKWLITKLPFVYLAGEDSSQNVPLFLWKVGLFRNIRVYLCVIKRVDLKLCRRAVASIEDDQSR